MNNSRRKQIEKIFEKLSELRDQIWEIQNDEQEAYENIPESLKEGERAQESESCIDLLDEAMESCDSAMTLLSEIFDR